MFENLIRHLEIVIYDGEFQPFLGSLAAGRLGSP